MKDLLCACNGQKCSGVCRKYNLNRKRVGLVDGRRLDKNGNKIYINNPHNICPNAYEEYIKPVWKERKDESVY